MNRSARRKEREDVDATPPYWGELERQDREKFLLFRRLGKLWRAVDGAAKRRGIYTEVPQEVLQDWCDRFRVERGLKSRRATEAWLRRNNLLNAAAFGDLVTDYSRLSCIFHNAQTSTGRDRRDRRKRLLVSRRASTHRVVWAVQADKGAQPFQRKPEDART